MNLQREWIMFWLFVGQVPAVAVGITIDDFSVGPLSLVGPTGASPLDYFGLDPDHVIGGARRLNVGALSMSPNTLDIDIASSEMRFATGSGPGLGSLSVVYGGTAPLDEDLTAGGHDRVRVRFSEVSTTADYLARFDVRDNLNRTFSYPINNGMQALNGVGGVIEFPYSVAMTDFANVDRIVLNVINYPVNGTFRIDEIVTAGPPLAGDYNRDNVVDLDDYGEWKKLFGRTIAGAVSLAADGNGDETVDAADYTLWRDHESTSGSGSVAAVPEPGAPFLAVVSILAAAGYRFRLRGGNEY